MRRRLSTRRREPPRDLVRERLLLCFHGRRARQHPGGAAKPSGILAALLRARRVETRHAILFELRAPATGLANGAAAASSDRHPRADTPAVAAATRRRPRVVLRSPPPPPPPRRYLQLDYLHGTGGALPCVRRTGDGRCTWRRRRRREHAACARRVARVVLCVHVGRWCLSSVSARFFRRARA